MSFGQQCLGLGNNIKWLGSGQANSKKKQTAGKPSCENWKGSIFTDFFALYLQPSASHMKFRQLP